jgi:hypothetical protein
MTLARSSSISSLSLALLLAAGTAGAQTFDFTAALDGKPIGTHRFVVSGTPAAREVKSTARFDVKVLGIPFYRYSHEATERWEGDCLRELHSQTDDDGKPVKVDQKRDEAAPGSPGCVMGFAYWHPKLHEQTRLLNPQTGKIEEAKFEKLPDATLKVRGKDVTATRWQLLASTASTKQEIVLWLNPEDNAWVGLDAKVKGRLLTYRLN